MTRPHFVVSDLHMGDGGPRDNFAHMSGGRREQDFWAFLEFVESKNGELTIAGDLFELWQANISRVIMLRQRLLDRLAELGARYIIGNHDIDLLYFQKDYIRLDHPLFDNILPGYTHVINDHFIHMIHGHEQDPHCCDEYPGIGRISAIYTGMKEDRNGGPLKGKYGVEARTLRRLTWPGRVWRRLTGKPSATQVMRRNIVKAWHDSHCDALIFGHTHEPGQFRSSRGMQSMTYPLPIYNCGSWAEQTPSFAWITEDGRVSIWDWKMGMPIPNSSVLQVK